MVARTVIAFDFGTRRIGIAIGQELTKTASPLTTIRLSDKSPSPDSANFDWSNIDKIIQEWQPQVAVVGLPLTADGAETAVTRGAKAFGEALQKRYNLETFWVDERLTSAEAESMIAANQKSGKSGKTSRNRSSRSQDKGEIDRMAAKLILDSWFNQA